MENTLYYFTATGNCLDVAKNIKKSMPKTEIISIPKTFNKKIILPTTEKLGIVVPVYCYDIPLSVKEFLNKLDLTNVNYIFAMVTCNFLPGLALEKIDDILKSKGKKLNSGFIIRMPGNYLPVYGANSPSTQKKKFHSKEVKLAKILDNIKKGNDCGIEKSKVIIDRLLTPKMSKISEKFYNMDRNFWVNEECTGCGLCSKVCAFDNIKLIDGKPVWQHNCHQCMACIQLCPKLSMQVGKKSINKKRYKNPNVSVQEIVESNS